VLATAGLAAVLLLVNVALGSPSNRKHYLADTEYVGADPQYFLKRLHWANESQNEIAVSAELSLSLPGTHLGNKAQLPSLTRRTRPML